MKNLIFLPVLLTVIIIQVTLLDSFRFFGVKPDLLIGFVAATSIYLKWKWAIPLSIMAGLLKDMGGTTAFGINTFLLPLWSCLILNLAARISLDDPIAVSVVVFFTSLLDTIVSRMFYLYCGKYVSLGIFLRIAFIEPLYTALAVLLIINGFIRAREALLRRKAKAAGAGNAGING